MTDDLLHLLHYINQKVDRGEYSRRSVEEVIKIVKKQIKIAYLEEEDE